MSFAHEDDTHREALARHLAEMVRQGLITLWHDRRITAGSDWAASISDALASADIVLLLVSRDFLDSGYCNGVELAEAMRLHAAGRLRIVPVILRSCDWQQASFARFIALPTDGRPVVEAEFPDRGYAEVVAGLRGMVAELRGLPPVLRHDAMSVPTLPRPPTTAPRPRPRWLPIALAVALLAAALSWTAQRRLNDAAAEVQRALHIGAYDRALAVGSGLLPEAAAAWWPSWRFLRDKARLGLALYQPPQDWQAIGDGVEGLLRAHPADADLRVLQAQLVLQRDEDTRAARPAVNAALKSDPGNAEAWFLLGNDLDREGDAARAASAYLRAMQLAPEVPVYRNNWAHVALESSRTPAAFEQAHARYQGIRQYPLSWLERAQALWALGRWREAADAQREALRELDDAGLMARLFNRRAWVFLLLSDEGKRLPTLEEKRCYAVLAEAASQRLAQAAAGSAAPADPWPPSGCPRPPLHVAEVLADDLCRYVDGPQAAATPTAKALRMGLQQAADCPKL